METARKKSKNKKYKRRKVEFPNVDEEIESVLKQQKGKRWPVRTYMGKRKGIFHFVNKKFVHLNLYEVCVCFPSV